MGSVFSTPLSRIVCSGVIKAYLVWSHVFICLEVSLSSWATRILYILKRLMAWTVTSCGSKSKPTAFLLHNEQSEHRSLTTPRSSCFVELAGYWSTHLSWSAAVLGPMPEHGLVLPVVTCCLEVRFLFVFRKACVTYLKMSSCPPSLRCLSEH